MWRIVRGGARCRRWTSLVLATFICSSVIIYSYIYFHAIRSIKIAKKLKYVQRNQTAAQPIAQPWKERVQKLTKNQRMPLLTLFTTWIDNDDKKLVHNITIVNWLSLRPFVLPIIFTNETALAKTCELAGWKTMPLRVVAADGVPVLKYMYIDAMKRYESSLYAFANGDILFTDTLIDTLAEILQDNSTSHKHTLIIGRRTNTNNITMKEVSSWKELTVVAKKRGKLFRSDAEDYFVTSASYPWHEIPDFVVGRRAYDNWLVLNARKQKHRVIDASLTILAVHQTTDDGNYESKKKETREYNHLLLLSLYESIKYNLGDCICAEYETSLRSGRIWITPRRLRKFCRLR
ncbi:hypothetical protein ACJMK2_013423 [Sinanodonta woodiana]|uniref:Uncharacterized protein n=1 Tax=Sinanodonta woodiana TaxID=1069815 RepID=A0ABD3UYE5_SINWO